MAENIRGIECSLYNGKFRDLLLFLSDKPFNFYVSWCMKIDSKHSLMPKVSQNFYVTPNELKNMANETIWEIVMHIYPTGAITKKIDTYDNFISSQCSCSLIFYDCGMIDIYVKESKLRNQLYNLLLSLDAQNIMYITDISDHRTCFYSRGGGLGPAEGGQGDGL